MLADFQISFTGAFCVQFAMTWLLSIPPHLKWVATLCYFVKHKFSKITMIGISTLTLRHSVE